MVNRVGFLPDTEYYDKRVNPLDNKIVKLIAERQVVSSGRMGFPSAKLIEEWGNQHAVPASVQQHFFAVLHH